MKDQRTVCSGGSETLVAGTGIGKDAAQTGAEGLSVWSKPMEAIPAFAKSVPKTFKTAFAGTFAFGLAAHMFMYANLAMGHDNSLLYWRAMQWDAVTGRLMGYLTKYTHNFLDTPWAIGIITLTLIGISAWCVCELLSIRRTIPILLTAGLMVTYPTITSAHCYLYMMDQFAVALMAACLSVYVTERNRYGFIGGIPLLVVSMANYQAYWCFAAILMLLVLIRKVIGNADNSYRIIKKGLVYLGTLLASALLYYVCWMLWLKIMGLQASSYKGMDQAGRYALSEIFPLIQTTYREVLLFFASLGKVSYYPAYVGISAWAGILASAVMLSVIMCRTGLRKQPLKWLLLTVFILLLPFAMNAMQFMNKASSPSLLEQYAFIAPWLLLMQTHEQLSGIECVKRHGWLLRSACSWVTAIAFSLTIVNGLFGANATYLKLQANYDSAVSTVTRILDRIETTRGYTYITPVAIVGYAGQSVRRSGFEWCDDLPGAENTALTYDGPMRAFLTQLGSPVNLVAYGESEYSQMEKIKKLPPFPSSDCVTWVGNVLVIKLS